MVRSNSNWLNYGHKFVPLHPFPVPDELVARFAMDHKVLTRTTTAGNTAFLVVVEYFFRFCSFDSGQGHHDRYDSPCFSPARSPFVGREFLLDE